ncbi:MAG: DNA recombination protein RmuC [Rhodospirillaceae bacterium]|nr:DNA recombination protein RmuC [Rhodospirillaceae bacterium]
MDQTIVWVLAAAVAGLIVLVAMLAMRASSSRQAAGLLAAVDELKGRVSQLADSQAAQQAALAERLQSQERALAQAVEQRLSQFGQQVGDRLHQSAAQTTQSLGELKERLAVIDAARKNITELSSQVVGLQELLSNKQARGAFGEVQLQDLVQSALPPGTYAFQAQCGGGRVDCLLHLPNPPGPIAIDAKFPLESYHALRQAADEAALVQARRAFAAAMRTHIRDIAQKYIVPGETAESALLFLPSEAVYAELHANFRNVVEDSFRSRVWIVSPTTLMATLITVRAVLKDVRMREQAGLIQHEVRRMLEDVRRLNERVEKLQRHFDQAVEDVRQVRISSQKVIDLGERIEEAQMAGVEPAQAELDRALAGPGGGPAAAAGSR